MPFKFNPFTVNLDKVIDPGATDVKVAVDAAATAGYLGAASNDGVLRAGSPISYTDGGDFVTLDIAANGINDTHIDWGTGASQVSAVDVPIADAGTIITATEVEGALQENRTAIDLNTTHRSSDGSDHSFIDQDVTSGSSPTFTGTNFSGIPASALPDADDDGATKGVCTFDNSDFNAVAGVVTIEDSGVDHDSLTNTHNLTTDIDHDQLTNFAANEHIDHTGVTLTAGTGLTGGGTIAANRTFNVDVGIADDKIMQVDDADAADNDYAKFTAAGLEGRSYSEVLSDLSGQAGSAFSFNSQNLTSVGTISSGAITSSSLTDNRVLIAGTSGLIEDDSNLTFDGSTFAVGKAQTITSADADNAVALTVTQNDTGATNAMNIVNAGTGHGLNIDQNGAGVGLYVDQSAANYGAYINNSGGHQTLYLGNTATGNYNLHMQNTNESFATSMEVVQAYRSQSSSYYFYQAQSDANGTPDNEFLLRGDGNAYCDGSWSGGGADYAEWFEKEEDIADNELVGLNLTTGLVRTWQKGDPLVGVQSTDPSFVGNHIGGPNIEPETLEEDYVMVALTGQARLDSKNFTETNRKVETTDGQMIGYRLADNKIFLKL